MPPSGHHMQDNAEEKNSELKGSAYNDEDIELLFEIVVQAQSDLPKYIFPTDALFSVYEQKFKELGRNPDHDSICARFLFRLGGIQGPETLYSRFEEVLSCMGITLRVINSGSKRMVQIYRKEHEDTLNLTAANDDANYVQTPRKRESDIQRQYQDTGTKSISYETGSKVLSSFFRPMDRNEVVEKISHALSKIQNRHPISANSYAHQPGTPQRTEAWLATSDSVSFEMSPPSHASKQFYEGPRRIPHSRPLQASLPVSGDNSDTSTTALTSPFDEDITTHSAVSIRKDIVKISEHDMMFKATLLSNRHLIMSVEPLLQKWKEQTIQVQYDNSYLDFIATHHDYTRLCRLLIKFLRIKLYHNHTQRRFIRNRDGRLIDVVFSHWSNLTKERIRQTAQAQNYITRIRLFKAWRNITVADELEARRQVLKRHFLAWKSHCFYLSERHYTTTVKYKSSLLRNILTVWVHKCLCSRLSSRRSERAKLTIFLEWSSKCNFFLQKQCEAHILRQRQLCAKSLRSLSRKTKVLLQKDRNTEYEYLQKIARSTLLVWSKEAALITIKHKIQYKIMSRQFKCIFYTWLHRTREEQRATATDRIRILREALVNWRLRNRAIITRGRLDKYLVERSLYRWVLEARSNLGSRIRNENSLRDMMCKWKLNWRASKIIHDRHEVEAHELVARKTQHLGLMQWYSRMGKLQQAGQLALKFYRPRIHRVALSKLSYRFQHYQELNRWSREADYYFCTSKFLKKWKCSADISRRNKRRKAYGLARRKIKVNLARKFLRVWLNQTREILDMQSQAVDMKKNRTMIIGMNIFDHWRDYSKQMLGMRLLCRENSLYKYFTIWQDKLKQFKALETGTTIVYQDQQASRALKKWNLLYLYAQARAKYALDVREKNFRRIFRKMFTYWYQQTKDRRPITKRQLFVDQDPFGDIARNEAWSELGENNEIEKIQAKLDQSEMPASVPGYLNTPSKRSGRIMAAVAKYSRTPKTPLPTLYERELRGIWSGGWNSSIRQKKMNKSRLGISGLKLIPENQVNDRNRSQSPLQLEGE